MKKIIITIVIIVVAFVGINYILNKNKAENEAKTAIVAEHYKAQGKWVEIDGVGSIEDITEKLNAAIKEVL